MIVFQFSFDVPNEKVKKFLDYSRSTLKKEWEKSSCKSYSVYKVVNERLRGDQMTASDRIIEQLEFDSMDNVKKFFDVKNLSPKHKALADSYKKLFNVTNVQSIVLERI
jgi:hypothetical protein